MSKAGSGLSGRLAAALKVAGGEGGGRSRPATLLVAWSGGVDSTVLLDLVVHDAGVRGALGEPRVVAAHLDHALRPESVADAGAVARTARAWGVELVRERLATPPGGEEAARDARYAFLERAADAMGADEIWTAHHADDEIETLLFRVARGTGLAGLAGIPLARGRLFRPFLLPAPPVNRAEIEAHATARELPVRPDATNALAVATRNRIRHELLPLLETVVPGARENLLRLARNARRGREELDALAERVAATGGFDAEVWADAGRPLRRALLRHAARGLGVALSEAATEAALTLPPDAQSGRGVDLPGDLRFERVFDRWSLRTRGDSAPTHPPDSVEIPDPGPDRAEFALGGRELRASWGPGCPASAIALDLSSVIWPLTLRGWREGDRIRRPFGSTPVAKAWAAARVPRSERSCRWVLVDASGELLAAEGLDAATRDRTPEGRCASTSTPSLHLEISA